MIKYKNPGIKIFRAKIQDAGNGGAYVDFPFSVEKLYGVAGRVPVKVVFEDKIKYRGSLVRMGSICHMVLILKSIRKELNKDFGDSIKVSVALDEKKRIVSVPQDIRKVLAQNPKAQTIFNKLSYSHKREYVNWVNGAKKMKTKEKRLSKLVKMLEPK